MTAQKRVLVVDDSKTVRLGLRRLLEASGQFVVVGEAQTAAEAVSRCLSLKPDLVTMDVYLGGEDGLDATREIMLRSPCPIVIVTGLDPARANLAFRATEVGALDVLRKPPFEADGDTQHRRRRFLAAVSALAQVKLVGTRPVAQAVSTPLPPSHARRLVPALLTFGASTGGPAVLRRILSVLGPTPSAAIVIVQHIEQGFSAGLAEFLSSAGTPVEVVRSPRPLAQGGAYLAPDDAHLQLTAAGLLVPVEGAPRNFQISSIDVFFESIPSATAPATFAALLSGMGIDGAHGLVRLAREGATTVVQSSESCVIPSMPEAARALAGATLALEPDAIARAARRFVQERYAAAQEACS